MVSMAIGVLTFSICTVYLICLGECIPPLLELMGAPCTFRTRRAAVILAAGAIFPMCMPKSLAKLSGLSLVGVISIVYTAVFSLKRYLDGTYSPVCLPHASILSAVSQLCYACRLQPLRVHTGGLSEHHAPVVPYTCSQGHFTRSLAHTCARLLALMVCGLPLVRVQYYWQIWVSRYAAISMHHPFIAR